MEENNNTTISVKGMGDEIIKAVHASKSYVVSAFLTLLFYYIGFYFIGLICNIIFLSQANESKRISGVSPSGRGCLLVLLWVHIILPIIAIIGLIMGFGLAATSSGY